MLDYCYQAERDDGDIDLRLHGILRSAPELLDFEVLLQPLEEQLYLPAVLVELRNQQGFKAYGVGHERKLAPLLLILVPDESQLFRVVFRRVVPRQLYLGIRNDVLRQSAFPLDNLVLEVALGTDDEERVEHIDAVQSPEVVVAPVEYVEQARLVWYHIHSFHVVQGRRSDVDKDWNLSLDIAHHVKFDAALRGTELGPFEHAQTQVDGCRVKRIDVALEFEDVRAPFPHGFVYHAVCEVFEDPTVPVLVGISNVASRDMFTHSKEVALAPMCFQRNYQVPQAFSVGQLTEHQDEKLVPACEVFDVFVAMILADVIVEHTSVKDRGDLRENVLVFVHLPNVFGNDIYKSVSFQNLCN